MREWKKFGRTQLAIMLVPMVIAVAVGFVVRVIVEGYKIGWNICDD